MDTRGPLLSPIFDRARRLEERDDVLSAAALMTQGWLDVPWHGWLTMVITDGNPEFADTCATELAEMCWERRQAVTSGIDFLSADESVPTALDLLGVAAPDDLDGSSLAGSVLHGQEMPERPVFAQYSGNPTTGDIRRCVVAGRYKYVFDPEDAAELHDVETDPLEMTNLAQDPDYREICERLHEACRMWGIDHGDPVFEPRNTADDSETAQPKQQH
jgi:hypothetical protein